MTEPLEITARDLIDLIDGLDRVDDDSYLDLTRWNRQGGGEDDERLTMVARLLARERLSAYKPEEIGLEILRQIDQREPRYVITGQA